jgi:hypothetical protein
MVILIIKWWLNKICASQQFWIYNKLFSMQRLCWTKPETTHELNT